MGPVRFVRAATHPRRSISKDFRGVATAPECFIQIGRYRRLPQYHLPRGCGESETHTGCPVPEVNSAFGRIDLLSFPTDPPVILIKWAKPDSSAGLSTRASWLCREPEREHVGQFNSWGFTFSVTWENRCPTRRARAHRQQSGLVTAGGIVPGPACSSVQIGTGQLDPGIAHLSSPQRRMYMRGRSGPSRNPRSVPCGRLRFYSPVFVWCWHTQRSADALMCSCMFQPNCLQRWLRG